MSQGDTDEQKAKKAAYMRAYNARRKATETPEDKERRAASRRAADRKRDSKNRDAINAKQRERREQDRERYRSTNRRWYAAHREQAYLASLEGGHRYRVRVRLAALRAYGGDSPSCRCCGETIMEFLCLDHINGGGNKHRKESGTLSMYEWCKRNKYPSGLFQILCHNCNMAKGFYGGCPHAGYTG